MHGMEWKCGLILRVFFKKGNGAAMKVWVEFERKVGQHVFELLTISISDSLDTRPIYINWGISFHLTAQLTIPTSCPVINTQG